MAIYSQCVVATNQTSGQAHFDIRSSPYNSFRLMEMAINVGGVTALSPFGLGRPLNDALVVQTSPIAVLSENPNDPLGQSTTAVAWSVAPTIPTSFVRRGYLINAVGAGIIWTFPRGLIAAPSRGIALFNILVVNQPNHVSVIVDE